MSGAYSRAHPSPRFQQLIRQYQTLHTEGERFLQAPPEQVFAGKSLLRHVPTVKGLIDQHAARTVLDYGAGKGSQYRKVRVVVDGDRQYSGVAEYWGVTVTCYDPGYAPFSRLPTGTFDGVVCTDVLEHCPEDDLPWILGELFGYAEKFLFASIACYPASKRLPTGENAHCTIRPPDWWRQQLATVAASRPQVAYHCLLTEIDRDASGGCQPRDAVAAGRGNQCAA